jgi:glycosyltransferase involved in cell wall biosynthesis
VTRVAHVATRFLAAGAERAVADVIHALPEPEYEHVLIVGREHEPPSIAMLCGDVRFEVVPELVRAPDPIRDPIAAARLTQVLGRLRPEVVHTIQSKSGVLGRFAARRAGVPLVVHNLVMANFGPGFNPLLSAVYRGAERLAEHWTDQYVACGTELRDRFISAGIGERRSYELIRSTVDTVQYRDAVRDGVDAARARLGLPPGVPIVLFAGSLDRRKGAQELPEFIERIRVREPDTVLVVAGTGPLSAVVEQGIERRGLRDYAHLLGFSERMPDLMAAADCLVMLSRAEGLATVLVQAVASGTPFVSYDVDGPRELIQLGATGEVVPSGDVDAAADAAARLAGGTRAPELDLSEWAPETVRSRYRELFDRMVATLPRGTTRASQARR